MGLDYPQGNRVPHQGISFIFLLSAGRPSLMPQKPSQPMCKHGAGAALRDSPQGELPRRHEKSWINIWLLSYRRILLRGKLLRRSQKKQGLVAYNNLGNTPSIRFSSNSLTLLFLHSCFLESLPQQSTRVLFLSFILRETQTKTDTFILRLNQDTTSSLLKPKKYFLSLLLWEDLQKAHSL